MPEFRLGKTAGAMVRWDESGGPGAGGGGPRQPPAGLRGAREWHSPRPHGAPAPRRAPNTALPAGARSPQQQRPSPTAVCFNNAALSCHLPFPHCVRSVSTAQDSRIKCFETNIGNTAAEWEGADASSGEQRARPVPAESCRAGCSSPSLRHAWQSAPQFSFKCLFLIAHVGMPGG